MEKIDLAIKLATTEKEEDIINILKEEKLWDNYEYWQPFGGIENNYSVIGNQQSMADAALVEKIINSVDAILMKECMLRRIDMSSKDAPQSISSALNSFFNIREGKISYLDTKTRNRMSESIILAATGAKSKPNIVLVDKGEGQTPNSMPHTILSISKNNKLSVPFVQGKYNMGGTGALPFCGDKKLQLVISKRCLDLPNNNDSSFSKWSFTIVRREDPREGRKSSMYTYLTDDTGNMLSFDADSLPIIPMTTWQGYQNMYYGTYIKLFAYSLPGGLKSNIILDLNYRLSMLIPELAHPVRMKECRDYRSHTPETTLSGLLTRLTDDRANNLEEGFPSSETFHIDGQQFKCAIYVFKSEKSKNYREKEGILYVVNGQTHATARESFFNKVNLSYLADSILILVDCSLVEVQYREDMFMNSRDRLRRGDFVRKIEGQIEEILRNHQGLKELNHERREGLVKARLEDDKPLQDVLQKIINRSPVLSQLLIRGNRISNPFNLNKTKGRSEEFEGKKHPTYFNPVGKLYDGRLRRSVPINHDFQLQFETDVVNDYFSRPDEQGVLFLKLNGKLHPELMKHLGLFNGIATLTVTLPQGVDINQEFIFETALSDEYIPNNFKSEIRVMTEPPQDTSSGKSGPRIQPPGKAGDKNRETPSSVGMPTIFETYKKDWDSIGMNEESGLILKKLDDGSDYYVNMDNKYLLTELKNIKDEPRIKLTNAKYKYGMALIALSIESYYKTHNNDTDDDLKIEVAEAVDKITSMLSPVLIPMIESMSGLEENMPISDD